MADGMVASVQPRGRDEVREALIEAAVELFAERGPAAVAVRDIASRAGVNHALLHRHFGTKQALLGEVLDRLGAGILASASGGGGPEAVLGIVDVAAESPYWRILTWSILDRALPESTQSVFPTVGHIVDFFDVARREGRLDSALDPNVIAAATVAMGLGWLLFEPFLLRASGLEQDSIADVRRRYRETAAQLLRRLGPE